MKLLHQTLTAEGLHCRCAGEDVGQVMFWTLGRCARALLCCKRLPVELHPDFCYNLQLQYFLESSMHASVHLFML